MSRPVVYVAWYNSKERHLEELPAEMQGIRKVFLPYVETVDCYIEPANVTPVAIFEALIQFRQRLAVFHYSGHAAGKHLQLSDKYEREQLVDILTGKAPRLVFLNGCETAGFVDDLLDAGAQAVIATSAKIGDSEAREFALNFYEAFLQSGKKLGVAFNEAKSTTGLSKSRQVRPKREPQRGLDTGADLPTQIVLYYRNPIALNWVLTDLSPLQAGIFDENIRSLTQRIEKLRETKKEKERRLYQLERLGEKTGEDVDDIEAVKQDIQEVDGQFNKENTELIELTAQRNRLDLEDSLPDKLRDLYPKKLTDDVYDYFVDVVRKPSYGAFLLQGTAYCGVEVLQEVICNMLEASFSPYRQITIHCETRSSGPLTTASLWDLLGDEAGWKSSGDPAKKQEEIMQLLLTNYLSYGHFIIAFVDAYSYPDSLNRTIIREFWDAVNTFFAEKPPMHKLLFFVLEKVPIGDMDTDAAYTSLRTTLSQRGTAYKTEFSSLPTIMLLPQIEKLPVEQIKTWAREKRVSFTSLSSTLQPENFMLQAIRQICFGIECESVFTEHFQPFFPKTLAPRSNSPLQP